MKQIILNPLFAPACVLIYIGLFFVGQITADADAIFAFTSSATEVITYAAYALAGVVALFCLRDFRGKQLLPFGLFVFLFICALLREMGAQHWLTKTDSTAFKIRFFTNPNNPLSEKIIAFAILAVVVTAVLYLLIRFVPGLVKGFFRLNPITWTVATLGGTMVMAKIADRLPGNYRKMMDMPMDPSVHAYIELLEESSESTLPLLFACALIQYHLSKRK